MAGTTRANDEFLESKRQQYHYFQRIIFCAGLAGLIGTFVVIWVIS